MDRLLDLLQKYGPPTIGVLIVVVVAFVVAGWVSALVMRALIKVKFEKTLATFLGSLAKWGVLILAIIGCLGAFGIDTTSFAAVIGGSALAVGLAFQGSLSSLAAGIMLLIFRPFKVDDVVNVAGQLGKIEAISLFTTNMDTFDNRRIIIPNSAVFGATIENITHHSTRRVDVAVGTEYSADLDQTREILESAAAACPGRLNEPETQVVLLELGASSVNWAVRVWANTADYWPVKQALTRQVKKSLDDAGLGIPFPQMDVHLDSPAAV